MLESVKVRLLEEGEEPDIRVRKIPRNNGGELTALTICSDEKAVLPAVYLEPFYSQYRVGKDIGELTGEVIGLVRKRVRENIIKPGDIRDDVSALDNVVLRLVNYEKNEQMLGAMPHIRFLDLAIIFRRVIRMAGDAVVTVPVTQDDVKRWNTDTDELYRRGLCNTERLFPLADTDLCEMLRKRYNCIVEPTEYAPAMRIITNEMNANGAAAVLYEGALEDCAEKMGGDIYLIPSSIHEMLYISADSGVDTDYVRGLIAEANSLVVNPEDFLSDSLYIYKRDTGKLDKINPMT